MSVTLTIAFDAAEGAVPRLLTLIERRGFALTGIRMESGAPARIALDLSPRDAGRCPHTLDRQLRRLHGIHDISVATERPSA